MSEISRAHAVAAVASIADPLRRSLYDFVSSSASPVSRDDAAAAVGVARQTAAFHLERLVADNLLVVAELKRLSGRTGPGSGRPAKLYARANGDFSVSLPPRSYDLAGELLAAAIEQSDSTGQAVRVSLTRAAGSTGRELGASSGSLITALTHAGYEPRDDGHGGWMLTNCPFHSLAMAHTELICHANVALVQGMADGADDTAHSASFAPRSGQCCVHVLATT